MFNILRQGQLRPRQIQLFDAQAYFLQKLIEIPHGQAWLDRYSTPSAEPVLNEESLNALFVFMTPEILNRQDAREADSYLSLLQALILFLNKCEVLDASAGFIAPLITADTINNVIIDGHYNDQTVAFWLAKTPKGLPILRANNYAVASLITAETLNRPSSAGSCKNISPAFLLGAVSEGLEILSANNFALASLIDADTLNVGVIIGDRHTTLASYLLRRGAGRKILEFGKHRLLKKIKLSTLFEFGCYNYIYDILDGKLKLDRSMDDKLSCGDELGVYSASPDELFALIQGSSNLSLLYTLLVCVYEEKQNNPLAEVYYYTAIKMLLTKSYINNETLPVLGKIVAYKIPNRVFCKLVEDEDVPIDFLLDLVEHMIKNLKPNRIEEVDHFLKILAAKITTEGMPDDKIRLLLAKFYYRSEAEQKRQNVLCFGEDIPDLYNFAAHVAGCMRNLVDETTNAVRTNPTKSRVRQRLDH